VNSLKDQRPENESSRNSLAPHKAWAKIRDVNLADVSGCKPPFLNLETLWLGRSLLHWKLLKMASSGCAALKLPGRSFKQESLKVGKGGSPPLTIAIPTGLSFRTRYRSQACEAR